MNVEFSLEKKKLLVIQELGTQVLPRKLVYRNVVYKSLGKKSEIVVNNEMITTYKAWHIEKPSINTHRLYRSK